MSIATEKTLKLIRSKGFNPWIVEKFNQWSGRRTDLYYIIDIVFLTRKGVIGVQSCTSSFAEHQKKLQIDEEKNTKQWLMTKGNQLILIGWRKIKRGKNDSRMVYKPRIGYFYLHKGKIEFYENEIIWKKNNIKLRKKHE